VRFCCSGSKLKHKQVIFPYVNRQVAQLWQRDLAKLNIFFDKRPALFAKSCTKLDFAPLYGGIRGNISALSEF